MTLHHAHHRSPRHALRDWLATLAARYDSGVMRDAPAAPAASPSDAGTPSDSPLPATDTALRAWCERGMGSGRAPLWRPWSLPDVPERLSLAVLAADGSGHAPPPAQTLVPALMRSLDRNAELASLAARSRLAGLRLKLAVKWHELRWWRERHHRQPWDSGYLLSGPDALARLAAFRPRRPTLLVAQGLPEAGLRQALATLQAAQCGYRHPVRLLLLDPLPSASGATAATATVIAARATPPAWGKGRSLTSQSPPA